MLRKSISDRSDRGVPDIPNRPLEIQRPRKAVTGAWQDPHAFDATSTVRTYRWLAIIGKLTHLPDVALVIAKGGLYVIEKESDDPVGEDSPMRCAPAGSPSALRSFPHPYQEHAGSPRIRLGTLNARNSECLGPRRAYGITLGTPRGISDTYVQHP